MIDRKESLIVETKGDAKDNSYEAAGPKYQHFDNTTRQILGWQNYNPFGGGQMDDGEVIHNKDVGV